MKHCNWDERRCKKWFDGGESNCDGKKLRQLRAEAALTVPKTERPSTKTGSVCKYVPASKKIVIRLYL